MKQNLDETVEQILAQEEERASASAQDSPDAELLEALVAKLTEQGAEGGDEVKIKAKAKTLLDKWNEAAGEAGGAPEPTGPEEFQNLDPASLM